MATLAETEPIPHQKPAISSTSPMWLQASKDLRHPQLPSQAKRGGWFGRAAARTQSIANMGNLQHKWMLPTMPQVLEAFHLCMYLLLRNGRLGLLSIFNQVIYFLAIELYVPFLFLDINP